MPSSSPESSSSSSSSAAPPSSSSSSAAPPSSSSGQRSVQRRLEEDDRRIMTDYRYREFKQEIQGVLASFDRSNRSKDWADLIRSLQKLNKCIRKYGARRVPLLPARLGIMKRLSQCLHPSLSPGVHMKTLETYEEILKHITSKRLANDLAVYSMGLLPLFPKASIQIKPLILEIIERHYFPLRSSLIPCLPGLVVSLMPALEEENSPVYQRTLKALQRIQEITDRDLFLRAVWDGILVAPHFRVAAFAYLRKTIDTCNSSSSAAATSPSVPPTSSSLPKSATPPLASSFNSTKSSPALASALDAEAGANAGANADKTSTDQETIHMVVGSESNKQIAAQALVAALKDRQVMVLRGVLEVLCSFFTLDANIFTAEQNKNIMIAVISLLTKQELSISRRVFQWIFGGNIEQQMQLNGDSNGGNDSTFSYFETQTLDYLVASLLSLFSCNNRETLIETEAALPYEIFSKITERLPEKLHQTMAENCIQQILRHMQMHAEGKTYSRTVQQLATQVIESLPESTIVWSELEKSVDRIMSPSADPSVVIQTFDMISSVVHMIPPNQDKLRDLFIRLIQCLKKKIEQENPQIIQFNLVLCINIFANIENSMADDAFQKFESVYALFVEMMLQRDQQALQETQQRDQPRDLDAQQNLKNELSRFTEIFKNLSTFMTDILTRRAEEQKNRSVDRTERRSLSSDSLTTGTKMHTRHDSDETKPPQQEQREQRGRENIVPEFLDSVFSCCMCSDPFVSIFSIETFVKLITTPSSGADARRQRRIAQDKNQIKQIVTRLWNMLTPDMAAVHFEIARLLVELHGINKTVCNAVISDAMLHYALPQRIEGHRRFTLIWRLVDDLHIAHRVFDDGLFLMLDSIRSENPPIKLVGRSWLLSAMDNINRVLDPLFQTLIDQEFLQRAGKNSAENLFDEKRAKHVLNLWTSMMEVAPSRFVGCAMDIQLSKDTTSNYQRHLSQSISHEARQQQKQQQQFSPGVKLPSSLFHMETNDYFSLLVVTCVRLLECGINSQFQRTHSQQDDEQQEILRDSIRSSTIQFLRNMLIHGREIDRITEVATSLAEPILAHLQISVEAHNAVFQFELLGILYAILNHLDQKSRANIRRAVQHAAGHAASNNMDSRSMMDRAPVLKVVHSVSFLPTLLQGVQMANHSQTSVRYHSFSLLQYWVDHIISFLPFLHTALPNAVSAIVPHFCDIVRENAIAGLDSLRSQTVQSILEGLRHILQMCVLNASNKNASAIVPPSSTSSSSSVAYVAHLPFRFFTDLVKDVFTNDEPIVHKDRVTPLTEARQIVLSELPLMIETMTIVWKTLRSPYGTGLGDDQHLNLFTLSQFGSLHTKRSIETAVMNFLNPLVTSHSSQLIASMVIMWANFHPEIAYSIDIHPHGLDTHLIDIINHLDDASPDIIINGIVDVIGTVRKFNLEQQVSSSSSKQGKLSLLSRLGLGLINSQTVATDSNHSTKSRGSSSTTAKLKETAGLSFLHAYLQKCILSEKADFIIANMIVLVRDALQTPSTPTNDSIFVYAMLFKTLYQFLTRWSVMDERRLRYNLKDVVQKLVEACVSASVREMQISGKPRKSTTKVSAKQHRGLPESIASVGGEMDPSVQMLSMLATCMVDVMQKVYEEGEPVNLVISMILPQLCQILRNHKAGNLLRIRAVVKLMHTLQSHRVLRFINVKKEMWSLFNETKFFHVDIETLHHWRPVVSEVVNERDRPLVQELLNRLGPLTGSFTATPITGNIFLNKNTEAQNRGRLLKRLAFVIFSGKVDEYASFIQAFQEKITESLKLCDSADVLMSQVFFFLRVLLARMSPGILRALWPMVVTELIRVLGNPIRVIDPAVLMEAIKFVDFAMVVLPDEFQMYKWMYLQDTETMSLLADMDTSQFIFFKPYLNRNLKHSSQTSAKTKVPNNPTHNRSPVIMDSFADFVAPSSISLLLHRPDDMTLGEESNSASSTHRRQPLLINRNLTLDDQAIATVASAVTSFEREQQLQERTAISSRANDEVLDTILENDFIEIESSELEELQDIVSKQHQRVQSQHSSHTSAADLYSTLPNGAQEEAAAAAAAAVTTSANAAEPEPWVLITRKKQAVSQEKDDNKSDSGTERESSSPSRPSPLNE